MPEIIEVHVKPGSKRSEILGSDETGVLKVALHAQPQDGKANAELVKLLKKHFGREASIKTGHTSKKKLVVLE